MTNNAKNIINISEIPTTDRLTIGRQLDKNDGPVTYMGRTVVIDKTLKAKDSEVRSCGQLINALTNARLSKKAVKTEEPASARYGAQMVYDDEGKIAGFFPGYANDQI